MIPTHLTIQDQLRAQYVDRWTTVHMTHKQSLAEHSFNVALLTMELASRLKVRWDVMMMCMVEAIYHDIDEVITGDIPTDTKNRLREVDPGVDKVFNNIRPNPQLLVQEIVKAADLLETAFQAYQHAEASVHACQVRSSLCRKIEDEFEGQTDPVKKQAWQVWNWLLEGERTW